VTAGPRCSTPSPPFDREDTDVSSYDSAALLDVDLADPVLLTDSSPTVEGTR
jgi:hypothetical protein